jgi:hypothetical protein
MKHGRYLMIGAAAAALAISGGIGSAQASAPPGWRVVFSQRSLSLGGGLGGLATTGPGGAWAVGDAHAAGGGRPVMLQWKSGHWTGMRLPALPGHPLLDAVGASSRTNVWVQGATLTNPSVGRWTELTLRWDGRRWKVTTRGTGSDPEFVARLLALGRRDVWSFGENGSGPFLPFARHFDGTRWRAVPVPGFIFGASALSARDIWAAGSVDGHLGPAAAVMRWTGKTWQVVARPQIRGAANNAAGFDAIAALSDRNVWAAGGFDTKNGAVHRVVLHFNGSGWRQFDLGTGIATLFQIVPDGLGGVWASDNKGNFFHFSHGRWTRIPGPRRAGFITQIIGLVHIPGTSSLWSTAILSRGPIAPVALGEILKFGR